MKKVILIVLALFLGGCSVPSEDAGKPSAQVAVEKIEQKEDMILVVESTTCSSCKKFESVIKTFLQRYPDTPIQTVVIEDEEFQTIDGKEQREYFAKLEELLGKISGTPFIAMIRDGEALYTHSGILEYSNFKAKALEYAFIQE